MKGPERDWTINEKNTLSSFYLFFLSFSVPSPFERWRVLEPERERERDLEPERERERERSRTRRREREI